MRSERGFDPLLLIPVIALIARLVPGARTIDDAYITFRYARNLLAGNGIVYNPGEAVFGASTPGYLLLLAVLALFTGGEGAPFPEIAWLINAVFDACTCWMLIKIGKGLKVEPVGIATALVWAIAPWSVSFAIGGMETSLLILLMSLTIYAVIRKQDTRSAIFGGLTWLTRPDALIFLGPLLLDRLRRALPAGRLNRERVPLTGRDMALFLLPVGLWSLYATVAYGDPLPHSISAKVVAYELPPLSGLVRLLQHYFTPFMGHEVMGLGWIKVGFVLYPSLYLLGALALVRRERKSWAFLIYPWTYLIVFAVFNPLIFRWYLTPPLPLLFLGIFAGAYRLAQDLKVEWLFPLAVAAGLVPLLIAWTPTPDHGPYRPAPEMAYIQLELLYRQAADELEGRLDADDVLAAGDIGALGYYTGVHVLDTVGLVSPQSVEYYPLPESMYVINYAVPPGLILDHLPEFAVLLEVYGREGLFKDPEFQRQYTLLERIPTDMYGSEDMLIFQRVE